MFLMGVAFGFIMGYALVTLFTTWQFKKLNNAAAYEQLAFQLREMIDDPNVPWEHHWTLDSAAVALTWGIPDKKVDNEGNT